MKHQGPAFRRIKGATRIAFHDFGSLEAVAEVLGISHSQAGRYQQVDAPDVITADKIAILESQDGVRPRITQELAAINGNVLLQLNGVDGNGAWTARLGTMAKEAGELMAGLGTALADGNITADEIARLALRGEVAALQSTLAGIDRALEEIERQTTLPRTLGGK